MEASKVISINSRVSGMKDSQLTVGKRATCNIPYSGSTKDPERKCSSIPGF